MDADAVAMDLAARQHGIVTRRQLVDAGVPVHRIEYRVTRGRLRPLHRGVYRVGPIAARREREMAAVLACGDTAVVSHTSAASLWKLMRAQRHAAPVEITIQAACRARGPGIRVHRVGALGNDEVTHLEGVPITTPARALLDLGACTNRHELERALAPAERRGFVEPGSIERLLARYPRRRGTRQLRALITNDGRPALTRSDAETRFLELIRRAHLRTPQANVRVRGYEVDCLWREERLVAEIDGFAFHSSRDVFERDRRRDSVLTAAGFRIIRVTWRQLASEPEAVLARVAQALVR